MPDEKKTEHCEICGGKLDYLAAAVSLACTSCGMTAETHVACPKGHVVCDSCHGKEARKAVEALTLSTSSPDPLAVAEQMMALPGLPMLSCDHAYIAAGSLLAALRNTPYGAKIGAAEVREVFARTAKQAHGGSCGLTGVCGIAPAVGAVFSVFLGARCGSDREQRIVMEAVRSAMGAITELTGPSCCKAYVRGAVTAAVDLFAGKFGIVMPVQDAAPPCSHSAKHPHGCREEKCPYYRKPPTDRYDGKKFVPGMTACVT